MCTLYTPSYIVNLHVYVTRYIVNLRVYVTWYIVNLRIPFFLHSCCLRTMIFHLKELPSELIP